jgi:hypothetical protein
MALHPKFPTSPYAPLVPEQRWFPADEALRSMAYEKLLPPLVAKVRQEVVPSTIARNPVGVAEPAHRSQPRGKIWIVETKGRAELDLPQKMARLKQWCADATAAEENGQQYDFVFVDQNPFEKWFQNQGPKSFAALVTSFNDYKG